MFFSWLAKWLNALAGLGWADFHRFLLIFIDFSMFFIDFYSLAPLVARARTALFRRRRRTAPHRTAPLAYLGSLAGWLNG